MSAFVFPSAARQVSSRRALCHSLHTSTALRGSTVCGNDRPQQPLHHSKSGLDDDAAAALFRFRGGGGGVSDEREMRGERRDERGGFSVSEDCGLRLI